ncbi:MAG: 3-phosphoshikimate 1-carboxyvinyltransferase [Hyphomicrobiaceae bacterium]
MTDVLSIAQANSPLVGRLIVPGDKSIAHRAVLFNGFAQGEALVSGVPDGGDVRSSIAAIRSLGAQVQETANGVEIRGFAGSPKSRSTAIDCGNSGTTIRLLMGLLAGCRGHFELDGDASLQRRPMERVAEPLRLMGAVLETQQGRAPVRIKGCVLHGYDHEMSVASAQLKTALLLAGAAASGRTSVREPLQSRDHSERMLGAMGVSIANRDGVLEIQGPQILGAVDVAVPGDPSSAAFFCVAAAIVPGSHITIDSVCLNPTRIGFATILSRMGADLNITQTGTSGGEPVGTIEVRYNGRLAPFTIDSDEVPGAIDELPILAVAAATAQGRSRLRGAAELRVKESDRISQVACLLEAMGAGVEQYPDGFDIDGVDPAGGATVDADSDHRMAMSAAIAGLVCQQPLSIRDAAAASVSFPGFYNCLEKLRT